MKSDTAAIELHLPAESLRLCAIAQGVNVHAGVVVPAGDRAALERLVRYLLRPALSLKRLSLREDDVG